jgi:hypothetical protein
MCPSVSWWCFLVEGFRFVPVADAEGFEGDYGAAPTRGGANETGRCRVLVKVKLKREVDG